MRTSCCELRTSCSGRKDKRILWSFRTLNWTLPRFLLKFSKWVSKSHKVLPRMHQNSPFSDKNLKKFREGGTAPSPDLYQTSQWGGDTPPHLTPFNFWGTSSPRPPPDCPWTTLGDFQSPSFPIAAFSGNESLCFSLRLCFTNNVCSSLESH